MKEQAFSSSRELKRYIRGDTDAFLVFSFVLGIIAVVSVI